MILEAKFRELVRKHLLPMIPGASMTDKKINVGKKSRSIVVQRNLQTLNLRPNTESPFSIEIRRSQKFSKLQSQVTELDLCRGFINTIEGLENGIGTPLEPLLLQNLGSETVARAACSSRNEQREFKAFLDILNMLQSWTNKRYEGKNIAFAVGYQFSTHDISSEIKLLEVMEQEYGPVLSNGIDTFFEIDARGYLLKHVSNTLPQIKSSTNNNDFCPYRLAPISHWTADGMNPRIALVLNRNGELMIVAGGELAFVNRGSTWKYVNCHPVMSMMRGTSDKDLKKSIIESCLDASFSHVGACIGVVRTDKNWQWKNILSDPNDNLFSGQSTKAKFIRKIVNNRNFKELDRITRLELLSLDGATVLNSNGHVVAAGAILKISSSSGGGGRKAAAMALSKYGMGIKVSQDGKIEGFSHLKQDRKDIFTIMN